MSRFSSSPIDLALKPLWKVCMLKKEKRKKKALSKCAERVENEKKTRLSSSVGRGREHCDQLLMNFYVSEERKIDDIMTLQRCYCGFDLE